MLGRDALRAAVSVGGNVELVPGAGGGEDFLPAIAGYDEDGEPAAGEPPLDDATWIGSDALADPDAVDSRGATVVRRLAALIATARRRLSALTGRVVTGAVVVLPEGAPPGALLEAVEGGGLDLLRLVEPEAAAAIARQNGAGCGDAELEAVLGAALIAEEMA